MPLISFHLNFRTYGEKKERKVIVNGSNKLHLGFNKLGRFDVEIYFIGRSEEKKFLFRIEINGPKQSETNVGRTDIM